MIGRLGLPELILILAIALIIFGPRKLPEIGRSIGKGIREFKQATTEVKKSVSLDDNEEEEKETAPAKEKAPAKQASSSVKEQEPASSEKEEPVSSEKEEPASSEKEEPASSEQETEERVSEEAPKTDEQKVT